MRWFKALFPFLLLIVLVWCLNRSWGTLPALGSLLDPVNGAMANADPAQEGFPDVSRIPGMQQPVTVWMDERWVPHIHAGNGHDLYLVQGYLHAYFRLWQMDMQTRAAGGRLSEVVGSQALDFDIRQRRKGMVYAAENSLRAIEAEPRTRAMLDAYRDGINAYIATLNFRRLPLEYKLMGFRPEPWTNLRSALLLKYMADDLTGATDDFGFTWLRDRLSKDDMALLYPEKIPGSKPVIPEGTVFEKPSLAIPPVPGVPDSLFAHFAEPLSVSSLRNSASPIQEADEERGGIGSNNWAVSGRLTASGAPILCNDPHLGLNLPALWYEVQLQAPGMNVYGVSLPGAPGVVIGFNDSLSWGLTNNYRDVKDYYEIYPADADHYWFNGQKKAYAKRVEHIVVKNNKEVLDTVLYTVHGPVQYDAAHPDPAKSGKMLAMTWMAHRPTNELLALYELNRASGYDLFVQAISHFECPAQNFIYADRAGNIALWGQGRFINKWKEQGRYVMEGKDSLTLWGRDIPINENPHAVNPPQGYLASANQSVTDSTYPYYYNGTFFEYRSWRINHVLGGSTPDWQKPFTTDKMKAMQNDVLTEQAKQLLDGVSLPKDQHYVALLQRWDDKLGPESETATLFQLWWYFLYRDIWSDEFKDVPGALYPTPELTVRLLTLDTLQAQTYFAFGAPPARKELEEADRAYKTAATYFDDKRTPQIETKTDILLKSLREAGDSINRLKGNTAWYQVKNTSINHLAKLPGFGYPSLKIGGWGTTINAAKQGHGPSWRMIVEMDKDSIRAYGVYPGGQSGNPGSDHYADMLQSWVEGRYFRLLFLPNQSRQSNARIHHTWTFQPAQS